MKRQRNINSEAAHEFIKPVKKAHWEIIMEGFNKLRVGGNYEELSRACGLQPGQVWRRLSEMERTGKIYKTGVNRPLSSGCDGEVWQAYELKEAERKGDETTAQNEGGRNPIFYGHQTELFQ